MWLTISITTVAAQQPALHTALLQYLLIRSSFIPRTNKSANMCYILLFVIVFYQVTLKNMV